jgi:Caspase domain
MMFRRLLLLFFLHAAGFAPLLWGQATVEEVATTRRVALVIGNGDYQFGPLQNPVNDARLLATALQEARFEVIKLENATQEQMLSAIAQFGAAIAKGGVGAFYFAGHGVQIQGENFLVPIDATMQREDEVRQKAVNMQDVLEHMANAKNPLNLVFLDACRNNPFPSSVRGRVNGLARMDAAFGTLISFATAPGQFAEEGDGTNSPYSQHLAAEMRMPGLRLEDILKRVRAAVKRDTQDRQITWDASSIVGDFYFKPAGEPAEIASLPNEAPAATEPSELKARAQISVDQAALAAQYETDMAPITLAKLTSGMRFAITAGQVFSREHGASSTSLQEYGSNTDGPYLNIEAFAGELLIYQGLEEREVDQGKRTLLIFSAGGKRYQHELSGSFDSLKDKSYAKLLGHFYSIEERETAKRLLVGKTLYVLVHAWQLVGDKGPGAIAPYGRRYVPVTAEDIRAAGSWSGTGWIIFRDRAGNRGVVQAILESRRKESTSDFGYYFNAKFSFSDPRLAYSNVSPRRWAKIEKGEIELGMSGEEVRLALGIPTVLSKISSSDRGDLERWRLGKRLLTLKNGRLNEIEETPAK